MILRLREWHLAVSYEISRLPDGRFKLIRVSALGRGTALSLARLDLEIDLKQSISKPRLEEALRTLDDAGIVTVEADLET